MTDTPAPPPGQAISAIARAIRSICSDGNANPHTVAVDIGNTLAHAGFEICAAAEITRLRAEVEALREALRLLVQDVADYPAWSRPCYALDVARAALRAGREDVR